MTATAQPGPLTTRHASLEDLATMLAEQHDRKIDVVAPPSALRARDGMLVVAGTEPVLTADGVDLADGCYRPTAVFDEGISDKLGIHLAYLRKLRAQAIDLYDANVNGWLDRADPRGSFWSAATRLKAASAWPAPFCRTATSGSTTWTS